MEAAGVESLGHCHISHCYNPLLQVSQNRGSGITLVYEMEPLITWGVAVWKMREAKNPSESLQSLYGCLYHIRT